MTKMPAISTTDLIELINKDATTDKPLDKPLAREIVNLYMGEIFDVLERGDTFDTPGIGTWSVRAYKRKAIRFDRHIAITEGRTVYKHMIDSDYVHKVHIEFEEKIQQASFGYVFGNTREKFLPIARKIKNRQITYPVYE